MEVTDQAVIKEYTEAVTEYRASCSRTLEQKKAVVHADKQMRAAVLKLPLHQGNLEGWRSSAAEDFACQLDLVASAYTEQAKRFNEQARALRRMNRAVETVQREAEKNENEQPAAG